MPRRLRWAIFSLALASLSSPVSSWAQDAHYWGLHYGPSGQLLGGTMVGGVQDLSSTYYSPGALALIEDPRFLISFSTFQITHVTSRASKSDCVLGRLQVYLVTYAVVALVLSFWVLPGLVTALTPLRYRDFVGPARDALMTAFATGNLLIVLPLLADESKKALEGESLRSEDAAEKVDVLVPVSFNFPNLGKLLSLSFVPFAAWFIGSSLSLAQYPKFLSSGMASFFGEVVVAMPFLLRLLDLPADLFQLFVTIDVFAGRFGTMLAAMHTLVFAILGACAMSGLVRLSPRKLARFGLSSGVLLLASVLGVRLLFSFVLDPTYRKAVRRTVDFRPPGLFAGVRAASPRPTLMRSPRRERVPVGAVLPGSRAL